MLGQYPFLSLIPPILAIALCFLTRKIFTSLLAGIVAGAIIYANLGPAKSFVTVLNVLWGVSSNADKLLILFGALGLAGMAGILGGSAASSQLMELSSRVARGRRSGQILCWLAGILVFFDDYASILITGNCAKKFADRLGISRAKLSYIVDSTAAPIATIALVSTWVGYKVDILNDSLAAVGSDLNGFELFLQTIPHSFYSIYALVFVFAISVLNRDFGPMRATEAAAVAGWRREAAAKEAPDKKCLVILMPIAITVLTMIAGLYIDGLLRTRDPKTSFWGIIANANNILILFFSGLAGIISSLLFNCLCGFNRWKESLLHAGGGFIALLPALVVLILAWGMSDICKLLGTGNYLTQQMISFMSPAALPAVFFITATIVSFTTGTSWGTISICTPLAVAVAWGLTPDEGLRAASVGAILGGAIFGDHCSPLSDTTIMSSMACDISVMEHTRTQLPYGIACAFIAVLCGHLLTGYGVSPYLCMAAGIPAIFAVILALGKKHAAATQPHQNAAPSQT